jgi:hypothetical protein
MLKNVNFRITALFSVIWRVIFHTFDLLLGRHCHSAHQCVCIKKVVALSCQTRNQAVQLIIDILMCVAKASHWQPVKTFDFGRYIILKMCYKTSVSRLSLVNSLLHV